jgi:DNA-binding NarL/FixJ family response regulator
MIPYPRSNGKPPEALTDRERQIALLVARAYCNKEIAFLLDISEQTVKNHMHNIFAKWGVDSRSAVVLLAIHLGLTAAPEGVAA